LSATYKQARDEMLALFNAAWSVETLTVLDEIPEIRWQGKEKKELPSREDFWCRISTQSVYESQITLSENVTELGSRRYESSGLVFVQIFCPKVKKDSYEKGILLAEIAKNAFRGKKTSPGNVWFRNVRINNVEPEELWYRFNVIAEFEYDEIG
jgi:hypothetical protein